jgi:hypothetical protein
MSVALAGCGYRVGGKADLLPKNIKTICVMPFANVTTRYRLSERLPSDLAREFISRTRYTVVADQNNADAILTGVVSNVAVYPTIFDPASGRATGVQAVATMQVTLTERATGARLFWRPGFEFKERYEISVDPKAYFDESSAAFERLSRDVARSLVSAILENF